jgi:hypothetical protein
MLVDGDFSHIHVENLEWAVQNGIKHTPPTPAQLYRRTTHGTELTRRSRTPPGQQLKAGAKNASYGVL